MEDERNVARLWKVNRTIHELVADRGYEVSKRELEMDLDTFREMYAPNGAIDRGKLNFYTNKADNPEDQIFIFFSDERNVSIKTMRKFIGMMDEKKIQKGIIIYAEKMTPSARKVISSMPEFVLEEFEEANLLVNITKHILVPQHEVMTDEEKKALLAKYRLRDTQLPRIQLSDPVARYYGLRRGQVVKVTRPSETAGRYASYRIAF